MRKGTTMPIDFIIIIVIAVIVIFIASLMIRTESAADKEEINNRKVFLNGCTDLKTLYDCDKAKVDDITYNGISLKEACNNIFGSMSKEECAEKCGCDTS